jgi:hypothetical protein
MAHLLRSRCKNGHEYTPENTVMRHRIGAPPYRQCRKCRDDSHQRHQSKREVRTQVTVYAGQSIKQTRDGVGPCNYSTAHNRCTRLWGSARLHPCIECGNPAEQWSYDGTDPDELCGFQKGYMRLYSRHPEFYMPLCRACHSPRDAHWRKQLREQFSEFLEWKKLQAG